ncbi:MAG: FecR domain-containing protein [Deltaproteobacteria bacterium]|nr:FecR domain-containing protein [Deltaproteobacteria bacterium]
MFLIAVVTVPPSSAADDPAMVVGRVFYIKGDLLRYVPEENDWVAVVRDAPFGTEDTLFSGSRGMAELIIPNGTWIRIGNSTQIQVIAFDPDLSEMDVASGVARFYNKSSNTVVKVRSPFGYVIAYPDTVFDFYVGENSVEVVAIRGTVDFVHAETDTRYDVPAGSPSILADQRQISSGEGIADPDWNRWNALRENFWATKARVRGRSAEYLPPSLQDEAYALEENGRWESVPYEGTSRWFWRPRVAAGWSPFTVGRWTDWYGDQTWIPAEPFGYVTHHYGNWVYMRNYWYWAPPVLSVRVGFPLLVVGFYWYPGRVSWIHTGTYVGWVPLAPRETYYSYHNWGGPHAVVVSNVNINRINVNVRNYAYVNRAIVVKQNNFYGVNNYTKVRVTNINPTAIINSYRAAPVVNNTVINNYTTIKQRYNYTTVKFNEKPHNTVINRIQQNKRIIREGKKEKASVVQQQVKNIPEGRVNREVQVEAPKATNYIVPAGEVNRPKSEIILQQREIKSPGGAVKPQQQAQPAAGPARASPATPPQSGQPAVRPERVAPVKPNQQEKPGKPTQTERVIPAKPPQSGQPAARPERVAPVKPSQQEKPGQPTGTERVSPAKPPQPAQPAARPERAAPVKPQETIKPPEKKEAEKPRDQRLAPKQIEKPKEPRPSEKNVEKRRERKDLDEEEGKTRK